MKQHIQTRTARNVLRLPRLQIEPRAELLATPQARLAVLIDAENMPPSLAQPLFDHLQQIGQPRTVRLYGNFTAPALSAWKTPAHKFGIRAMQLFNGCQGKNASDMALVIDAMDLVYSGHYDGICIVSNDSDFSPLAIRIRDAGLSVYGFGTQQAAHVLASVCDRYIRLAIPGRNQKIKKAA